MDTALGKIDALETSIEPFSETYARFAQLVKALSELRTYIVNNRHVIPNYGERHDLEGYEPNFRYPRKFML